MFEFGYWLPRLQPAAAIAGSAARRRRVSKRQDDLLDAALKETFPASDPVSVIRIT